MLATDKGRFCASCQKNVVDFTKASDRQIAIAVRESDNLCGRFNQTQLNRDLIIPKEKNKLWVAASAAVVTLLTIGNNQVFAQTPVNIEQTQSKTDDIKAAISEIRTISGTVEDSQKYPLPATQVTNTSTGKLVQTDFDGLYSIEAKKGDTIVFRYVGMVTIEIIVAESNVYNITMHGDSSYDFSDLFVEGITIRRTFFGRIFHSVGDIFR